MTRDEALSVLHCPDAYGGIYGQKYGEALDMAMQALKDINEMQAICEDLFGENDDLIDKVKELENPCEDCISRQAVIDRIKREEKVLYTPTGMNYLIRAIKDLPPVTPTRARGEWIPVKYHEATEQEIEENGYSEDVCYILDNLMPNDEEEILVTVKSTSRKTGKTTYYVRQDTCYLDDGFSLDSGYDWITDVIAWKPLPEPYKEESEV